jgi:hypothetical protein
MGFVAEERNHHKVYPPPEQVFTWTQMCDIRDVSGAGVWLERNLTVFQLSHGLFRSECVMVDMEGAGFGCVPGRKLCVCPAV